MFAAKSQTAQYVYTVINIIMSTTKIDLND